jgi:hypothetical protein
VEKFFEGIGNQLFGTQPFAAVAPALLFWTGGLIAWAWAQGVFHAWSVADVNTWLTNYAGAPALALIALALVVISSSLVVNLMTLPVLRLIEGYWPAWGWVQGARRRSTARLGKRLDRLEDQWQTLGMRPEEPLDPEEKAELAALDRQLRLAPADPAHRMPTTIGNILRAAELRPLEKYGLDSIICWPRLWLLLPAEVQKNIGAARDSLDAATRAAIWGVLTLVWSVWTPLAAPLVALIVVVLAYRSLRGAAETYGDLLESAFDLHRFALYRSVGWPLPATPVGERACGLQLTEYLFRGTASPAMRFTFPTE